MKYNKSKYRTAGEFRKSEVSPLSQVIEEMMQTYRLNKKFDQTEVVSLWPKLMGNAIANRTKTVFMKNSTLFIQCESSALKHELSLNKARIIDIYSDALGRDVVKEVKIL